MSKRKTPDDYHGLAASKGFTWLGPEVKNTRTKTWWRCSRGHEWETRYGNIKDWGCPHCAGIAPKTPEDYHAIASENGIKWKGPFPKNTSRKTWWECSEEHRWYVPYSSIQSGRSCMICYRNNKMKTKDDYRALAKRRGFKWISQELPPNVAIKTEWECEEGHRWMAHFGNINHGFGCPYCAGNIAKIPEDYHRIAQQNGFEWIGPEVPNVRTKTGWQCKQDHQWKAIFATIQNGHGCPHCIGVAPKTASDYVALAKEKGFEWLGPLPPNVRTKTSWRCAKGHEWQGMYTNLSQGIGCPACYELRRPLISKAAWASGAFDGVFQSPTSIEIETAKALDNLGIEHESQYRPDGYGRTYDEFILPNILLELHGDWWHGDQKPKQQKKDAKKAQWAKSNGFIPIIFWEHEIKEWGADALIKERILPLIE